MFVHTLVHLCVVICDINIILKIIMSRKPISSSLENSEVDVVIVVAFIPRKSANNKI